MISVGMGLENILNYTADFVNRNMTERKALFIILLVFVVLGIVFIIELIRDIKWW